MSNTASRRLDLSVQYACHTEGLPSRADFRRWARACLAGGAQVTIRLVNDEEGQALNAEYRGKNYATNVLSFPYETAPKLLGDLVICHPVVLREATAEGHTADAHYAHLVVHGMLHLQGYDHETSDEDAEIMESEERKILAMLGYSDPYAGEP